MSDKNKTPEVPINENENENENKPTGTIEAVEKKKHKPNILRRMILLICLAAFIYSGYTIIQTLSEYAEARQNYQSIKNVFYDTENNVDIEISPAKSSIAEIVKSIQDVLPLPKQVETKEMKYSETMSRAEHNGIQLDKLKEMNPDTYGWIRLRCPNDDRINNMDYIIMQSTDNDYYLSRDFFKNYQKAGAIYSDFRVSRNIDENYNTIIYGHNMGDNSMFGPLSYFNSSFDKFNASTIELHTWDGSYIYEIFSVYETYPDSRGAEYNYLSVSFTSEEHYMAYLEELQSKSSFRKDIELTPDSRIITLSTCTNNRNNTRFAIHGVLVNVIR